MIETLENDLGVQLFIRSNAKLELTPAGREIYKYSKYIVKRFDQMIDATRMMSEVSDYMTIFGSNSMLTGFLPKFLKDYCKDQMVFRMTVMESSHAGIIDAICDGTADMGFTSEFSQKNVTFIPLFKDPVRLLVPSDSRLATYDEISPDMLDGIDLISIPAIGDDVIQAVSKEYPFHSASQFTVHSDAAAISMVDEGLGTYLASELHCIRLGKNTKKYASALLSTARSV